ncbi:MAG: carbonic anhydrase [Burkholderiaceae bacterium]
MCLICERSSGLASPARRRTLAALGLASMTGLASLSGQARAAIPKPDNILSPSQALERLMRGNERYASNQVTDRDFASSRGRLATAQNPYACVLGCADSRVSPELCFDEARGDLFVTRIAGNYVTADILASLEYGVAVLKAPLIMVLGHTRCGAISATVDAMKNDTDFPGHIQSITTALMPAVRAAAATSQEGALIAAATKENIRSNVRLLQEATPILRRSVREQKLKVVGGIYRLDTGRVELVD